MLLPWPPGSSGTLIASTFLAICTKLAHSEAQAHKHSASQVSHPGHPKTTIFTMCLPELQIQVLLLILLCKWHPALNAAWQVFLALWGGHSEHPRQLSYNYV